jgi:hypothetical protein
LNNIKRLETSIHKKRMELLRDPNHIKKLIEIKEIADKTPRRGRPPIVQTNSQDETSDWMRSPFDPFRSLSQKPLVQINEENFISDANDEENITSHSVVQFLGDAEKNISDINLRYQIPDKGNTPVNNTGYQERGKNHRNHLLLKKKREKQSIIHKPKKKSKSDIPGASTKFWRT